MLFRSLFVGLVAVQCGAAAIDDDKNENEDGNGPLQGPFRQGDPCAGFERETGGSADSNPSGLLGVRQQIRPLASEPVPEDVPHLRITGS